MYRISTNQLRIPIRMTRKYGARFKGPGKPSYRERQRAKEVLGSVYQNLAEQMRRNPTFEVTADEFANLQEIHTTLRQAGLTNEARTLGSFIPKSTADQRIIPFREQDIDRTAKLLLYFAKETHHNYQRLEPDLEAYLNPEIARHQTFILFFNTLIPIASGVSEVSLQSFRPTYTHYPGSRCNRVSRVIYLFDLYP